MTTLAVSGVLNMTYQYSATQNNGQITAVSFTPAFGCGADGRTIGDPKTGDTWTVVNGSVNPPKTLTATTLGSDAVNITFAG